MVITYTIVVYIEINVGCEMLNIYRRNGEESCAVNIIDFIFRDVCIRTTKVNFK